MKNLVACFGWGALLKKKKKVVGHFSIFRYSTWTKEINISSRGSKPQGYIYMKKTPRVRESSTFQERGTGERSQCPDTQDGEENSLAQVSLSEVQRVKLSPGLSYHQMSSIRRNGSWYFSMCIKDIRKYEGRCKALSQINL